MICGGSESMTRTDIEHDLERPLLSVALQERRDVPRGNVSVEVVAEFTVVPFMEHRSVIVTAPPTKLLRA